MNKVYVHVGSETRDTQWLVSQYEGHAFALAAKMQQLEDIQFRLDYLKELTGDDGEPAFLVDETIKQLGKALAATVSYLQSYKDELESEDSKNPND